MSRQGRVLVVDDKDDWRDLLSSTLRDGGFHVDAAETIEQARNMLTEGFYHLAVLDIRMEDRDPDNKEGMSLLGWLSENGTLGAMEVIMLSAFGTIEQMREAFANYRVADFLSKDKFDNRNFLKQVREMFDKQVRVNFNLNIQWEQTTGLQDAITNLEVDGSRIKRDTPRHALIADELDDLLCRLFHKAESLLVKRLSPGHGGSAVLMATPFYQTGAGLPSIVKFGDFRNIDKEYKNFKDYSQNFVGGARTTSVVELRRTPRLGGIVYSLLGAGDQMQSFASFYARSDISQIKEVLDRLFQETCGGWYANPGVQKLDDLSAEYRQLLGFTPENLEKSIENLKKVQGNQKHFRFNSLSVERNFRNPISAAATRSISKQTYTCITHGDLNESNIMVDEAGHAWLIDFEATGPGHILRDVAKLDSVVRFQLLSQDQATMDERLALEEALCSIERFGQVERLVSAFQTDNPDLEKAYATVVHLRTLAHRLISRNTNDDISEYYVALLYYAINTIRYFSLPATQREHALLSASLLADRLGL